MGSSALTLVNEVLLLTGDYQQLTTIAGNPGNIGERIVGFMNLAISDIERKANWSELRVNSTGTGDGVNNVFDFSGTSDVRADSVVSAWITGLRQIGEVTPEQYDIIIASQKLTGQPQIFQRGSSSTGKLEIKIFPAPAVGDVINVSAYKRATRFTTTDTSTTELDDDLIKYGALMHMDAYDDMNRGYAELYKDALNSALAKLYSNSNYTTMVESYA